MVLCDLPVVRALLWGWYNIAVGWVYGRLGVWVVVFRGGWL